MNPNLPYQTIEYTKKASRQNFRPLRSDALLLLYIP